MYRNLDFDRTLATLEQLERRIGERFPNAGLRQVCRELCTIAKETRGRISWAVRPNLAVRFCVVCVLALGGYGAWEMFEHVKVSGSEFDVTEFVPMFESATNAIFLIGAALYFLITLESRLKRQRILKSLHELRAVAHVIDMHQLTKDPGQLASNQKNRTASSPARTLTSFQLARYLDYCSEMLSLIGKLGSLYAQSTPDEVILQAVNDIETLSNGLSRKIWQKITMLERHHDTAEEFPAAAATSPNPSPTESNSADSQHET